MTDKELVERLLDFEKVTVGDARDAALRIEALTAKLEKLVSIEKRVTSFEDTTEELLECGCARCKAHLDLRAALAEIEGSDAP